MCKSPDDLKGTPILRGPNSPTQGISDLLNKLLTSVVACLKTHKKTDLDFLEKLPSLLIILTY